MVKQVQSSYGIVTNCNGIHDIRPTAVYHIKINMNARVAQVVEQGSRKAQVVGSNPISGPRVSYSGNTSAFQADAVGSIPSTRSI